MGQKNKNKTIKMKSCPMWSLFFFVFFVQMFVGILLQVFFPPLKINGLDKIKGKIKIKKTTKI